MIEGRNSRRFSKRLSSISFRKGKSMTASQKTAGAVKILSPQKVLNAYYLDTRWHLLEVAAMLDRSQRAQLAYPEDETMGTDLRAELLRRALTILASDSPEPNRAERLLTLFTELDPKERTEG